MTRFVCIHGHFYQPPRENPWLEAIDVQESAAPFHDWNERITQECYQPNACARILDDGGRITRIINNYSRISFNFGPTLLSWLERSAPETYHAILEADRISQRRFGGMGSAIAQAYNHAILPLCNDPDRRTQVLWGLEDFARRFQRPAEGMWLPETAVDTPTLEALAESGVRFTLLAPSQAGRTRGLKSKDWAEVNPETLDTRQPYRVELPSGRSIDLFFYDGALSQSIAFGGLLNDGRGFADSLLSKFTKRSAAQLVHVATDGESYGHHHRFGDMALATALQRVEDSPSAELTNYGAFLDRFPPTRRVAIRERTAWSCSHGVGRWQKDCGCKTGGEPEWTQAWRKPLREALDWLRDRLAPKFESLAGELCEDPWQARDRYIDLLFDGSESSRDGFFAYHARRPLAPHERIRLLELFEMQRNLMLMYTSCGWFFDELSGIETVQILQYAARAIQLAESLFATDYESGFLAHLERAPSNIQAHPDGRRVYEQLVRPAIVDPARVAVDAAVAARISQAGPRNLASGFELDTDALQSSRREGQTFIWGNVQVVSKRTAQTNLFYCVLFHPGDHALFGGVVAPNSIKLLDTGAAQRLFASGDRESLLSWIRQNFGEEADTSPRFSSWRRGVMPARGWRVDEHDLLIEQRRDLVKLALRKAMSEADALHQQLFERNETFLAHLQSVGRLAPRSLLISAERILQLGLEHELTFMPDSAEAVEATLKRAESCGAILDTEALAFVAQRRLSALVDAWRDDPLQSQRLDRLARTVSQLQKLPFEVDLQRCQNAYFEARYGAYTQAQKRADAGDSDAKRWVRRFLALGDPLRMAPPAGLH